MINKPTIIITSLGRTGTKFFSVLFNALLTDATSLHQPDVIDLSSYRGIVAPIKKMREAKSYYLLLSRILGYGSLIGLSDAKFTGQIKHSEAVRHLIKLRKSYVKRQPGKVYIESSAGYYGLLDILPEGFVHHRAIYIVRDGRDWVRSEMNRGKLYRKSKIARKIGHIWPTTEDFPNDPYYSKWREMSRFEKVCWAWTKFNQYALETAKLNPNAHIFQFEDLFVAEDRYQRLTELVYFATAMPGVDLVPLEKLAGWLDQRINQSPDQFPAWEGWSGEQQKQFSTICAPLMEELGYF